MLFTVAWEPGGRLPYTVVEGEAKGVTLRTERVTIQKFRGVVEGLEGTFSSAPSFFGNAIKADNFSPKKLLVVNF